MTLQSQPGISKAAALAPTCRVAFLGDSITDYARNNTATKFANNSRGYAAWVPFLLNRRIVSEWTDNYGIAGQTSAEIAARVGSVVSGSYDWCVVLAGTNDVQTFDPAVTIANITGIYDALLRAGVRVCALPIPPRGTGGYSSNATTQAQKIKTATYINNALRAYVRSHRGCVMADSYMDRWADQSIGDASSGYTVDNVHPTPTGAYWMGRAVADALSPFVPVDTPLWRNAGDMWDATLNPAGNMLTNGFLAGTGGTASAVATGAVADGWTSFTSLASLTSGTATFSKEGTRSDGLPGERQVITLANAKGASNQAQFYLTQTVLRSSNKFTTGDVLEVMCEMDVATGNAGLSMAGLRVVENDGNTSIDYYDMESWTLPFFAPSNAYSGVLKSPRITVRPIGGGGTPQVTVRLYLLGDSVSGPGITAAVKFGRVSLRKVG